MGTYQEDLLYNEITRLKEVIKELRQRIKGLEQDKSDLQPDLAGKLQQEQEPTSRAIHSIKEENARLRNQLQQWEKWYEAARQKLEDFERLRAEVEGLRILKRSRGEGSEEQWQKAYEEEQRKRKDLERENEFLRGKNRELLNASRSPEGSGKSQLFDLSLGLIERIKASIEPPAKKEEVRHTDDVPAVEDDLPSPSRLRNSISSRLRAKNFSASRETILPKGSDAPATPGSSPAAGQKEPSSRTPPQPASPVVYENEEERQVSEAFVAWCQRGGAFVSRYYLFEKYLHQSIPVARVRLLQRDRQVVQVIFPEVASDPVEYWFVETKTWEGLLPQPQSEKQFRELSPCFEGDLLLPKALSAIKPALLQRDGQGALLRVPGLVR